MNHGSLFSGVGGFDLAAQWMGWNNVFHCEWNPFGQQVLNYYWPDAISYTDITKTDFAAHRGTIDILTGGFPCQPYSAAGKRLGKEDDRHLWPEMLRAIREIQPRYVVGENVRGLTNWNGGLVFDEVQADLESEGYEVLPFLLPACAVNAPHRRDRIWFVAHRSDTGIESVRSEREDAVYGFEATPHPNNQECNWRGCDCKREGDATEQRRDGVYSAAARSGEEWDVAYAPNLGLQPSGGSRQRGAGFTNNNSTNDGNDAYPSSPRQQERHTPGLAASPGRSAGSYPPDWSDWPTQSPLCDGNDGLSGRLDGITFSKWRNESIKAGGNAIVPQVVYQIFKAIESYEA